MSTENNKAVVRRYFAEVLSGGNVAILDELLAPTFVFDFPGLPGPTGRAQFEQVLGMFRAAFPDWRDTVEELIAEGDRVAVASTGRGTHRGEFLGIPPTGKAVSVRGLAVYRLVDGKIAEDRVLLDRLGLLEQLGVTPAAGTAGA